MPLEEDLTKTTIDATSDVPASDTGEVKQQDAAQVDAGKPVEPKSPLEAVTAAFAKIQTSDKPDALADSTKTDAAQPDKAVVDDDLTAGKIPKPEWDALPGSTRKRIQQFRERLGALTANVQSLEPKARTYDDLSVWMGKNGVSQDDFVGALEVAALLKSDPLKALERLTPIIEALAKYSGEKLPEDLQKDVTDGIVSKERATEIARLRSEEARLRLQGTARTEADALRERETQVAGAQARMVDTVKAWEARWKEGDPDYPKKSERVWERMVAVMSRDGVPQTPDACIKLAEDAKKYIETYLADFQPKPREIIPVNGNGNAANTNAVPKTALEAVRLGLQAAHQ